MHSDVLQQVLSKYDQQLAETRDKKRYQLKDNRTTHMDTLFGSLEIKRSYYFGRVNQKYVCLLDRYLAFEASKGVSPLVEEMAMELAATGSSYRHASSTLEKILGYSVISHEAIRQHLLQTEVVPSGSSHPKGKVLFVEIDGLYVKRQPRKKRGREEKIAAVHEGWSVNGKRTSLTAKWHYIHSGTAPFWDGFDQFYKHKGSTRVI